MRNTYFRFKRKLLGLALVVTPLLGQAQAPGFTWANQAQGVYGGTNSDQGNAIARDGSGNSYVTGYFMGSTTFGSTTLNSSGFGDVFVAKYNSAGAVVWAVKAGGTSWDEGNGIAVDASGNTYVTGNFEGTATFGSLTIASSASNQSEVFVAKFDASGNALWVRKGGGLSDDYGYGIAVDASGSSYITGVFEGSALFGSTTLTSTGYTEGFAAKYDAAGALVWAKRFGGPDYDDAAGIAVDASGNSYITGYLYGTATYGSISLTSNASSFDMYLVKLDATGTAVWAKRSGGTEFDNGYAVAVDASGNSYVTGYFMGTATFGSTTLTSSGNEDVFVAKYNNAGTVLWATKAGGTGEERGTSIAIDPSGNSYITGQFYGTATFGTTALTSTPGGYYDLFVAKFDASGNPVWAQGAGAAVTDLGLGIAADANGSYVTGYFNGTVSFGSTTLTSGADDIFVAKYNTSGTVQWATNPTGFSTEDIGYAIASDAAGNSYVTGYFQGNITFGSTTLTSTGNADVFVAKYNNAGTVIWARRGGGTGTDEGTGIAVDGSGNSYVTGKFNGSATFGSTTLNSSGDVDVFLVKYDAAGTVLWARQAGGSSYDYSKALAVDASGNSSIVGYFEGSATFGGITLNSVNDDIFVARYDASGTLLWAHKAGGGDYDQGRGIAVDGSGNSYVTGTFKNNATFGSVSLSTPTNFNESLFVAKYDASGTVVWATKVAGSDRVEGNAIAVDASGNSYVTGEIWGSAAFGGTTLNPAGSNDIFIAKLDASGAIQWAKKAGGTGQEFTSAIAVDGNGNSQITGIYLANATFGTTTLTNSGFADVFVAKYDAAGNAVWAQKAGGANSEYAYAIAMDGNANSYLTGVFSGTFPIGSTTLTSVGAEMFIAKISATHTISTGTLTSASFCPGNSLTVPFTATGTFSAGNVFTAQLSNANGIFPSTPVVIGTLAGTTSGNIAATIPAATASSPLYRIRVISSTPAAIGTDNGSNITISVPAVGVTATPASICEGQSSTLNATGAATYNWTAGNGLAAQAGATVTATPMAAGNYTYTVTGTSNGCTATATVSVSVTALPAVAALATPATICAGASSTLNATGATTYSWNTGQSGSSMSVSPAVTTTYTVTGTANGCSNTATVTLNVTPLPPVAASATPAIICEGQSASLDATGAITYDWTAGNGLAAQSGSSVTVTPTAAGNYTYTVTGTNNGCTSTATVGLSVTALPTVSATSNPAVLCQGQSSILEASGATTYSWAAGIGLAAQTGTSVSASPTQSGTYTYTVTGSSSGCTSIATTTVTVAPALSAFASPPTINQGSTTTLSVGTADTGTTYTWNGPNLNTSTGSSVTASPVTNGAATYTVTADNGFCTAVATVTVTVTATPGACMNGTYSVNPALPTSGANFQNITDLTSGLQVAGMCGPVVVNFVPGIYTTSMTLGAIPGSSAINTVTINGSGSTFNFCSGSASQNVNMILLNGTDNIAINGFTLNATCTYGTGIRLMNGTENVSITNNTINVPASGPNSTSVHNKGIYITNAGTVTITGNTIIGGRRGIEVSNQTGVLTLNENTFRQAYEYGIGLVNAPNAIITDNLVQMRNGYTESRAFDANMVNNLTLERNYFFNAGRAGVQLQNTTGGSLVNNRSGFFQTSPKAYGMYLNNISGLNIYHNSISVDKAAIGNALRIGSSTDLDVRNNIFQYAVSGGSGVPVYGAPGSFSHLAQNNYHRAGAGAILVLHNKIILDLSDLQDLGYNIAGSFVVDPGFTTGVNFLDGMNTTEDMLGDVSAAMQLSAVDFEMESRPQGSGVSLGADEFAGGQVRLTSSVTTLAAQVYPNPFQSALTIQVQDVKAGAVQVTLTDLMGRQIMSRNQSLEKGANSITVQAEENLAQGVYLLQVTQGGARATFRVVKQ